MKRITDNIEIDQNGCWVWLKSTSSSGYGQLTVKGKYWQTHRYAYTQAKGDIPDGLLLRHTCHNIKCCNPDHLVTGTDLDNWHDSKDVHLAAQATMRKQWIIGGIKYPTVREASKATGIHMATLIKYTENGVFNTNAYRAGCKRARVPPKL